MEGRVVVVSVLVLCLCSIFAQCEYHKEGKLHKMKEKVTHLHFFFHDIVSGNNATAVLVAQPKNSSSSLGAFGSVFAVNDILTERVESTSKVIGNSQGLYVSTGRGNDFSLVLYLDFGFTTGKYNGSSFSVFSRNPIGETERELAVVGGRGKFRMARGFAKLKTRFVNFTTGDAIVEYNVSLFHY